MKIYRLAITASCLIGLFVTLSFAQKVQLISLHSNETNVLVGQKIVITANYDVQADENIDTGALGLGLRVHFDSNKLKFVGYKNSFIIGKTVEDATINDDLKKDLDQSTATDKYVLIAWSSTAAFWPNMPTPVKLTDLVFEAIAPGSATVNVSFSSVSSGFEAKAESLVLDIQ